MAIFKPNNLKHMVFKIEKETRWNTNVNQVVETFYIWADNSCVGSCNTEKEARQLYEYAKQNFVPKKSEIIMEEEIN